MSVVAILVLVVVGASVAWWARERAHRRTRPVPPGLQTDVQLDHDGEYELYHNSLSLCSKKVRVCMAELGVPYRSHHVDLIETGSYQNLSRAFLLVNPAATVPVLVHRGHPVYESHEQIRYAADHAPASSPPLVPDDPEAESTMQAWVDLASIKGDPLGGMQGRAADAIPGLTIPLFASMIPDIGWTRILEGVLFHIDRRRPVGFLALKAVGVQNLHRIPPLVAFVRDCREHLAAHLEGLESQLRTSGGPWIVGEQFTLADVSWLVLFARLDEADYLHVFLDAERRPQVSAYWRALQARPSCAEALGRHAHPLVMRGGERLRAAKDAIPALRRALEGER